MSIGYFGPDWTFGTYPGYLIGGLEYFPCNKVLSWRPMICWAPSQYPKRRLIVRIREVSKSRDLYLELSDISEIWQALRQYCCRCACQISKRYDNLKYQSRGFETSRDLTIRRLFDIETGLWFLVGIKHLQLHQLCEMATLLLHLNNLRRYCSEGWLELLESLCFLILIQHMINASGVKETPARF